ncbi:MAG TPA: hypothetical protein DCS93_31515 [Microscillaceae bacterium]|nr:hypothetical protein [Microscillaceae bacterium]
MSKSINCQFTLPKGSTANYENHRVIISYTKIIKNSEGQTTLRPISEPISLLPTGIFAVLVPEETEVENQHISITLKSPTGATLFNQTYQYNQLYPSVVPEGEEDKSGLFKIEEVAPQLPITLGDAGDVGSSKVKGKAILFEDGSPLANTNLFIWGAFAKKSESSNTSNKSKSVVAEDATPEPSVIQVVKTDIDGYFSFEIENKPLDQAYVQLAGQEKTFPLTLDEQNFLKDHQIVVSEVTPDHQNQDDDCGCKQSVPTLPDAEDLVNSSVYSQDLGGTCIDFTTPNRSLEEFSYFHIVRTTEPEIRKTPYQKPPLLNPFLKGAETTTQSSNDTTSSEQQANQHSTKDKSSSSAKGGGTSWDGSGEDKFGNAWDKRYRAFLIQYLNSPEGRWWIFTQDITSLTYIQNNPILTASYANQEDEYAQYAQNNYVTIWKQQLNNLYNYVYGDSPTTENELYDFLLFIHQEYVNEYGKSPKLPQDLIQFVQSVFKQDSKGRVELDGRHAVDWDETPTLYHNTTIAHGHILNFKQIWKADGYSLGDLLYSLPLAPCQKKQIAIFDWDRTNTAQRDEFTTASEQMDAYLSRDRDISEVVNTALGESMDASSSANANSNSEVKSKSFNVGGSVGVQAGPWSASVSAGYSSGKTSQTADSASASEAFQNSARNLSASTMQNVQDNVMQGASAVRSQRSTVVETVGQSEQMNVQTEVITNHNHCHSLTIEYFEVLRHFAIEQKLVDVQECLFIPLEMTPFDMDKILRWKSEIANFLNDHYLLAGITALEKIKSQTRQQPTILADEPIRELMGKITLSMVINRPADVEIAGQKVMDDTKWSSLQGLLGSWTISRIRAAIEAKEEAEKEQLFREEILPEMFANFIDKLIFGYIDANGQDVPLNIEVFVTNEGNLGRLSNKHQSSKGKWQKMRQDMANYDAGSPIMLQIRMLPGQNVRRSDIERFYIKSAFELPEGSQVEFVAGSALYRTNSLKENLFTQNPYEIRDDLNDQVPLEFYTPLNERERYNPLLEAYEQANHLIEHLNEHLEFFHKAIWFQMSPDRRFMLLDGFIAPHSNGKSVASVVENRLMGVVGNNLVMPVARGFHLDPTFAQKTNDDNQATPPKSIDLLAHYQPTTPKSPFRVSVPTRGVYAEAVQGACNSCEKIDESRHWRFTEVPCGDEPTAIQPISTDSRYVDPGNLQAKDLPPNIVNFQNVPAAPDPTGLNAALNVLSNPDLFRDITGLDANQANAISALLATQKGALDAFNTSSGAAKEYAKMATDLAMNQSAIRNKDTVLNHIEEQRKKGNISDEQANQLTNKHLENMVGGSSANDSEGEAGEDDGVEGEDEKEEGGVSEVDLPYDPLNGLFDSFPLNPDQFSA